MSKTLHMGNFVNVNCPTGDRGITPKGSTNSSKRKTTWKWPHYIGIMLAALGLGIGVWSLILDLEKPASAASVVTAPIPKPRGAIDEPWPGKVPWAVTFRGPLFNVPTDRQLFIWIKNSAGQQFYYHAQNLGNKFECLGHHLGERFEIPGKWYEVRLFLADKGENISEGLCTVRPRGDFISEPVSYQRRARLPGEE